MNSKKLSTAGETAKQIRKDLKIKFPKTKFSVRSDNFAGGNAVNISYTNSVPRSEIEKAVAKYEYGKFDGMTDCYEYTNSREDIPQVKYIMVDRTISDDKRLEVKKEIMKEFGIKNEIDEEEWFKIFNNYSNSVIYKRTIERTF